MTLTLKQLLSWYVVLFPYLLSDLIPLMNDYRFYMLGLRVKDSKDILLFILHRQPLTYNWHTCRRRRSEILELPEDVYPTPEPQVTHPFPMLARHGGQTLVHCP